MSRRYAAIVVAAVIAAFVGAPGAQAAALLPTIYVDYRHADCTFRLTNDDGATVTQLAPGTYQVAVSTGEPFGSTDLSGISDLTACKGFVGFRLTGPGVSVVTTLDGGDGAFELHGVVFQAGATYTIQDDHNVAGTRRTLVASASAPAPIPAPSASPTPSTSTKKNATSEITPIGPVRGVLAASVTTAGKLALTFKGKPVLELRSGKYRITVLDETARTAFKLQRRGGKVATTVSTKVYLGRRTVTVSLARGQWWYFSSPARKHFFVVVA